MQDVPPTPTRRRVLGIVATAGVAPVSGCSTLWEQPGATDVVLYNASPETETVSVGITDTGADADTPHTSRTLTVSPGATVDPVNRSKLPTNTSYTVDVSVAGGPHETFEWADPTLELAPLYVLVDDTENIKFLLQAG
jgi:hypothetical protein